MLQKPEWIIVSKIDEKPDAEIEEIVKKLKKQNPQIVTLSILDDKMMKPVIKILNDIENNKI
jgi:ABC-type uncharacterized transport system substrate-binding protein